MRTTAKKWAGTAALALLVGCSTAPKKPATAVPGDYGYTKEYVSWLIRKEMAKNHVTGLSIALVDDQRVVWAEGFGFADRSGNVPATPRTIYRAGSISKLFTATAAMQLAERGRLNIDEPLRTCLPEFSVQSRFPDDRPITPRNIMTHHSGLPSDLLKGMWTKEPEPFENVVRLLRDEYVAYPPEHLYSYSNLGVTVLGVALERASGSTFAAWMETSLFRPLRMSSSSFSSAPDHSPLAAKAYRRDEEAEEIPLRDVPAGGLNSTVLDLSRFIEMVLAGGRSGGTQIIAPDTLAEMLRPQNADVPLDLSSRTGLGWALGGIADIDGQSAGPVAHHSGATLFHRSTLIVLPERKLGVVVLSNSATAGGVVHMAAVKTLALALEAKTGVSQPARKEREVTEETLSRDELRAYTGRYATFAGVVTVREESGHLSTEFMGKKLRLVPRSDGMFGLRHKLLGLIPISLGELDRVGIGRAKVSGREIVKARVGGEEVLAGERIETVPIPESWLKRVGEYEIVNAGADTVLVSGMRLRDDAGLLVVDYSLPLFSNATMGFALAPLSDGEAVILGLGRGMGETIRVVRGDGGESLRYSGYLLRKKVR